MVKIIGAAASAAICAGAFASGGVIECVPLGNLLDDPKGTSLINAIASDTYGAGASVNDLGVSKIVKGNLGGATLFAPGLMFNAANFGGAMTVPAATPNNDRVYTGSAAPISSIGTLLPPSANSKMDDGIGLWGDMVLSFDLNEIRVAGGLSSDQDFLFSARGGINDFAPVEASLRVAVIVSNGDGVLSGWINGQQVSVSETAGVWSFDGVIPSALTGDGDRLRDFLVPVPSNATQISLVSVSLDDGNYSADGAVFANAMLCTSTTVPAPAALAVLGGGLLMGSRRRR